MAETVGEAHGDEVAGHCRHDRDGLCHLMRGIDARTARHQDVDLKIDELHRQRRHPVFLLVLTPSAERRSISIVLPGMWPASARPALNASNRPSSSLDEAGPK